MRKTSENIPDESFSLTTTRSSRQPLRVNDWVLHSDLGVIRKGQQEVRLNAKCLHVLLVLIDAMPQGVAREQVLDRVWGELYPTDTVVSRAIADLRSAFGERAGEQRYIRTLPKFGYQLIATVEPDSQRLKPRAHPVWLLATAFMGALAIGVWLLSRSGPDRMDEATSVTPQQWDGPKVLTANPGIEQQPRLSADGETVVYAAKAVGKSDWDLYQLHLDEANPQPIAAQANINEHGPALSPTATQIAYVRYESDRCEVVTQPLHAAEPRAVASCTTRFPTLVDWSTDGQWLAFTIDHQAEQTTTRPLALAHPDGNAQRILTTGITPTGTDYYPRFSPDGQRVAFLRGEPQPDHRATLWLVNLDNGKERALTTEPVQMGGHTWLDDNTLLFSHQRAGRMLSSVIDTELGQSAEIVASNLIQPEFNDFSQTLIAVEVRRDRDLLVLDGPSATLIARSTEDDFNARWSPNEQWLAYISRRSGHDELWLTSSSGEVARRLSRFQSANIRYLSWNSDNQRLLFSADTGGQESLYEINIISGLIQQLDGHGSDQTSPVWLADGNAYVYGCLQWEWALCLYRNRQHSVLAEGMYRPQALTANKIAAIDDDGILHEIDVDTGASRALWSDLPALGRLGWFLREDRLFYLAPDQRGGGQLWQRSLEGEQATLMHSDASLMTDTVIDISMSGRIVLTSGAGSADNLVSMTRK